MAQACIDFSGDLITILWFFWGQKTKSDYSWTNILPETDISEKNDVTAIKASQLGIHSFFSVSQTLQTDKIRQNFSFDPHSAQT